MNKTIKHIAALILLWVFLFPSMVKLEHHHDVYKIDRSVDGKQFNVFHEQCYVCSFEFSLFSADSLTPDFRNEKLLVDYCCNYKWAYYSSLSNYSFLLRAPPALIV